MFSGHGTIASVVFCMSLGLDISYAILGDWTLKSNSWCYSRYNQCRTSDRGHARVLERHAEIQTMSELR